MRPAKPTQGLKSFSWTCCGLILSFGLTTLNLVPYGVGSSDASAGAVTSDVALELYHRLTTDTVNTDLFDKVVDLTYENEQLRSKIQVLQDKLKKAYEFMKQFVINGRNMLDVFRERIGEVKEWVHRKVPG
ncbi:MAG: hypothetical protein IJ833_00305 [Lachnospiraceae bacterium]|nr:hypothetical protein [Lachnospiraceae bacterium]